MPEEGSVAPEFTLLDDTGTPVSLSALRGSPVVLYFYPKDDTPSCTTEACGFRDLLPRFQGVNAHVLGVSPDTVASHAKFRKKFALPFRLLADEGHVVAEQYGVWGEKRLFGLKYVGVLRTTFLIGPDGRIARVYTEVKSSKHAAEVAEAVQAMV